MRAGTRTRRWHPWTTSLLSLGNSAFGLYSNARTVARRGRALFGGSVLDEAMRSEMLTFVPAADNIPGESGAGLGVRNQGARADHFRLAPKLLEIARGG